MTYCRPYQDWPRRIKLSKNGVVHAARTPDSDNWLDQARRSDGHSTIVACKNYYRFRVGGEDKGYAKGIPFFEQEHDATITCKNCLRELGDRKEVSERFVIVDKDGLFLKGISSRTGKVADAKLFKVLHAATRWCTVWVYFDKEGNPLDGFGEWSRLRREGMAGERRRQLRPGLRIFKVTLKLGEEVEINKKSLPNPKRF
jgi:hypothetical protein